MVTREQYEFAQARIEELLPLVTDSTPANDKNAVELSVVSDVVIEYEKHHYPIGQSSVAELIALHLQEKQMTQRELAKKLQVSPSRVNDFITGRSEPSLRNAAIICQVLSIPPALLLGIFCYSDSNNI